MQPKLENKSEKLAASRFDKSDAELLRLCRTGSETAWNELVERFQRLIFAIPRRAGLDEDLASDIFQDVFLELFKKLDDIEQPDKIRAWLVTTAKFKTWGAIRERKGVLVEISDEDLAKEMENLADETPLADEVLVQLEEQHLIRMALKSLEERCRAIISMIYLRETPATYAEVAENIGVGETSISPMRSRCLKKLTELLKK